MNNLGNLAYLMLSEPEVFLDNYFKLLNIVEELETRAIHNPFPPPKNMCIPCHRIEQKALKILKEIRGDKCQL